MSLSNIHFIRPLWLLAIIPLIAMFILFLKNNSRLTAWEEVCDPHLLPHLMTGEKKSKSKLPLLIITALWLVTVLALAGPTWQRLPQPVYQTQKARVIILDLSPSMLTPDIVPSRLVRARYKLLDLLKQLNEGQTALIVFSGEAYTVSPLTQDTHTIASMVSKLSPELMPIHGHNLAQALLLAEKLMKQAGQTQGDLILITDLSPTKEILNKASSLQKEGYKLSVLGIGTAQGAPIKLDSGQYLRDQDGAIMISQLNIQNLQKLAANGGGTYVNFSNNDYDIQQLLKATTSIDLQTKNEKTKALTDHWKDEGRWLILLLLPFAALAFRQGWLLELMR